MASSDSKRLISLDYFRGICAVVVALSHFLMQANYGDIFQHIAALAVEAFFPLSGFVLGEQIIRVLNNRKSLGVFLLRRWMRTLPPYLIALIMISVLLDQFLTQEFFGYLFFVNYLRLCEEICFSDFFPIAWSLSIEEWFYILFPVFLIAVTRRRKSRIKLTAWTLGFVIFFVIARGLLFGLEDPDQLRTNTLLRLDSIAFGFLLFIWFSENLPRSRLVSLFLLSLISLLFLFFGLNSQHEGDIWIQVLLFAAPIFFGTIIALLASYEEGSKSTRGRVISTIGVWLGRTSYSMYLFHLVLIYLFFPNPTLGDLPLFLFILLLFCAIFYWTFERPILELRPKYAAFRSLG